MLTAAVATRINTFKIKEKKNCKKKKITSTNMFIIALKREKKFIYLHAILCM